MDNKKLVFKLIFYGTWVRVKISGRGASIGHRTGFLAYLQIRDLTSQGEELN